MDAATADEEVITQPRCPHCLREFYVLNQVVMSLGKAPCPFCGNTPPVFTRLEDYHAAMRKSWEAGRG